MLGTEAKRVTWPTPDIKCDSCHRFTNRVIQSPNGWVCLRCDMRGIYDRASYLQREGFTERNPMNQLRAFRGILLACFLGALLWALIWLLVEFKVIGGNSQ